MTPLTRQPLSRRALLRGLGAAIALPALESMAPAAKSVAAAPGRMVFIYVPNGIIMDAWTPAATGPDFELKRILKPLEPLRQKFMLISGMSQENGRPPGDNGNEHARASAAFLTGVHPKRTVVDLGPSVDQVAAEVIGKQTRFRSLEFTLEEGRKAGTCDGFNCAYSHSISWRSSTLPNPPEMNPRLVFERLFGDFDASESADARARRLFYNSSILDFVKEDVQGLQRTLGANDRRKLDEYLISVREIETRITHSEKNESPDPEIDRPAGVPAAYHDYARLMYDLLTIALQSDLTRIATFIMAREGSTIPYREIGITDGHHALTHNQDKPDMMEKLRQINTYHVEQLAHFLNKLDGIEDGDGRTLLDNSLVVYGSGLSDGNLHSHTDLPVLLAGGGGKLRTGRHLRCPDGTPMTNLFLSMLDKVGVPTESLGDSTGKLEYLSEIG